MVVADHIQLDHEREGRLEQNIQRQRSEKFEGRVTDLAGLYEQENE